MNTNIIFLDNEIFNIKYTILGMSNSSLILENKESKETVLVHKRVLNAISRTSEPIPCCIREREYRGKTNKWLATFFTV